MKAAFVATALLVLAWGAARAAEDCGDCHRGQAEEFARTTMARAAINPAFRAEWAEGGHDGACLGCHAPSGGQGVACADCHGGGNHPYAAVPVPGACARCHDAPGEATVRTYRASLAARAGKTCLDCHLGENAGHHAIRGASDPTFLHGIAQVRLALSGNVLVAAIRHSAGHALPGGTTGRAVWLVLRGLGVDGTTVWEERRRYGWLTDGRTWQDHTLAPDHGAIIEIENPERNAAISVEARLLYSRRPTAEPEGEELSRATMTLR